MILNKIKELTPVKQDPGPIKFHGTQTQFVELIKSLIENENLKGVQKEIFQTLSQLFNIQLNNPEKIISDITNRNIGSETLFLDELQKSLTNYLQTKSENKKNRG